MKTQQAYNAFYDEALFCDLSNKLNIDKKIIEIMFSRGFNSEEKIKSFISPRKEYLENDPFLLSGMEDCCKTIKQAISKRKRILIFGDYDVDGICATYIMIKTIQALGYNCNFFLPNRFVDGYGLTNDSIDKVLSKYETDLMITVDCGISCHDEIEYAKSKGIDVVVTDHHEIPIVLPNCTVVDPKLEGQKYPCKFLCGAGVAFKVAQALLGADNVPDELLAVATIATIADIVPLADENRALTYYGLKVLDKLPIGLKMMFSQQKISLSKANSNDISFKISPRLNSSGRMGEAADSLFLFLENNPSRINIQLQKINKHNLQRQEICANVFNDCEKILANINMANEKCIILKQDDWDSGILGIVCAKLVETYHRPVFLFSKLDGELRGSGRSIESINIHDMLTSASDYLIKFGGHSMAAGLSLKEEKFDDFVRCVKAYIQSNVNDQIFYNKTIYDLQLTPHDITEKFFEDLQLFEPCGNQNPKPLFKISTENPVISSMKSHPEHTIIKASKLNLLYFNSGHRKKLLKHSKQLEFVFEFQNSSYKRGEFDALVKMCDEGFEINNNANDLLAENFLFETSMIEDGNAVFKTYKPCNLAEFLYDAKRSMFGTLFVANNLQTYNQFISKFDISGVVECYVGEVISNNAVNAILFAPASLKNFNNFKNIIFLDNPLSISVVACINKISNATCHIPASNYKLAEQVSCDRKVFAQVFLKLKSFGGLSTENMNVLQLHKKVCPKCSVFQFIFCLQVFNELNIVNYKNQIIIDESKKTDLTNSKLYNIVLGHMEKK